MSTRNTQPSEPLRQAVIYVRVSTDKQSKVGDGLRSQERMCREFARFRNLNVIKVFSDIISGEHASRPNLDAMIEFLANRDEQNCAVIIDDVGRLSREFTNHWTLRGRISMAGGHLMSPQIEFSDNPVDQLPEKIQAIMVEQERLVGKQRSFSRQKARTLNGYWTFNPGPGYEYIKSKSHGGKTLIRKEPTATILAEALNGFASGRFQTQMEMKRFLDAHPQYPKGTTGKVPKQNIRKLLSNILYTGYVEYKPWGVPLTKGHHEPIISHETYQEIQDRLNGRPKFPVRKSINEDFPLRGFIDCADCEKPLRAAWSRGRLKRYAYYVCQTKNCVSYGKSTPKAKIESEFEKLLSNARPRPIVIRLTEVMIEKFWAMNIKTFKERQHAAQRTLSALENKISALVGQIINAPSQSLASVYEAELEKLERKRILKTGQLDTMKAKNTGSKLDFETSYRTVMNFIENPSVLWRCGRIKCQRAALKFTFAGHLSWCRKTGYRTAELSLPFKLLGRMTGHEFALNQEMVPHR